MKKYRKDYLFFFIVAYLHYIIWIEKDYVKYLRLPMSLNGWSNTQGLFKNVYTLHNV